MLMAIGYHPNELADFNPTSFVPKKYTWLINFIGYIGYLVAGLFVFYGTAILYFPGLREVYFGDAIAALFGATILIILSRYLIKSWGVKYFYLSENSIVFDSPLRSPTTIYKDDIIHIAIDYPTEIGSILPLAAPSIIIATYDKLYRHRSSRWYNQEKLLSVFSELSQQVHDPFAEYYHRSKSTVHSFLIRMSQDTAGVVGLTIITIYFFLATWGGWAILIDGIETGNPYVLFLRNPEYLNGSLPNYNYQTARFHPPNNDFWFGTDFIGRDVFARLVYGTSFTFLIALSGSLVSMFFVAFLGITSAMFRDWWDTIVTRAADALLTFPPFIPLILISTIATPIRIAIPGGYFFAVFIGMSIFTWPLGARIIRSEIIDLLNNEYIQASKQIGAGRWYILRYHILPKILPTLLILFSYSFTDIILATTLLGFIGMDSESTLTWGSDLAKAVKYGTNLADQWWTILFPTIWIFFLVFGLTLFSDSIRDNFDPHLRGGIKAVPLEYKDDLGSLK